MGKRKSGIFWFWGCLCGLIAVAFVLADTTASGNVEMISGSVEYTDQNKKSESQMTDEISSTSEQEASRFEVHYIDVGQADAALVICDDAAMLIDGGNRGDSSLIYTYLKEQDVTTLNYVVATHPHEDHIGGLSGALNFATAEHVLCSYSEYDSSEFENLKKHAEKQGVSIEVPSAGDSFTLGGATVEILACNSGRDENNNSIVLKISYGDTSFLFTGDAELGAEQAIIDAGCNLSSTVLKVGHHGSDDSTSYAFLREIMPQYAVISVGEGNEYGHPTEEVLSRLRDAEVETYRTDLQGNVVCVSDGTDITFKVEKNADADTLALSTSGLNSTAGSVLAPNSEQTPDMAATPDMTATSEQTANTTVTSEQTTVTTPEPTQEPANSGTGAYAVNGRNGKIHMNGACPATGTGDSAMKNPVYFDTYEEAENYSKTIDAGLEKRKCGNCW